MKHSRQDTRSDTDMKKIKTYIDSENIISQKYNRQIIQKALVWLRKQPHDLTCHITDVNLAVKLYLKSQEWKEKNKAKNNSFFVEELQKFSRIRKNSQKEWNIISETIAPYNTAPPASISVNPSPASFIISSQETLTSLGSKASGCNEALSSTNTSILSINSSISEERSLHQKRVSKRLLSKSCSVSMKRATVLKESEEENQHFLLDAKSRKALEKAQSQLNLPTKEVLKVLIQLGCHSLQTLFNPR